MSSDRWDIVIRGAHIFDGTGATPFVGSLAVRGDRIAAVGEVQGARRSKSTQAASRSHPASSTSTATTTSPC